MWQFLIPALIGAATNKDDPLKGALIGGTLGALTGGLATPAATGAGMTKAAATGGMSAAANPITGALAQQTGAGASQALSSSVAANAAASKAAILKASQTAATGGMSAASNPFTGSFAQGGMSLGGQGAANPLTGQAAKAQMSAANKARATSLFSPADLGLNVNPATGQSLSAPTDSFSSFQAQNAANKAALDSAAFSKGTLPGKSVVDGKAYINPVGEIKSPMAEKLPLSLGARLSSTARSKPMESAGFVTQALGGGQKQMPMQAQPLVQKPYRPIEQPQEEAPKFVPKPLFEQEKRKLDMSRNKRAQDIIGRQRDRRSRSFRTRGLL